MTTFTSNRVGVAVIGAAGPHSSRTHIPALAALAPRGDVELRLVVDLEHQRPALDRIAGSFDPQPVVETVGAVTGTRLSPATVALLDAAVDRLQLGAVIIATPPAAHGPYLRWAIRNGLHVLCDKPLLGYPDVSNDPAVAHRLLDDHLWLEHALRTRPSQLVCVAVQRRHHPGFSRCLELIEDVAERFRCPITSMQSSHADGQFRTPAEIESIGYHGYREGDGKLMHSGSHLVDVQARFGARAAELAGLRYDHVTATAAGVRPSGFLRQVPGSTYVAKFGDEGWRASAAAITGDGVRGFDRYGELDLAATLAFETEGAITQINQITLLHNSFSRRSWPTADADLYKGNGRVKHEHHQFVQGPFQTIQIHSYQSRSKHDVNTEADLEIGGNSHFDIHVFRNEGMWDEPVPAFEIITALDLTKEAGLTSAELLTSHAKRAMVVEFVDCITGRRPLRDHPSRLDSHGLTSRLMATLAGSLASGSSVRNRIPSSTLLPRVVMS